MHRITKRFTFEAAHQLPNHQGKCRWMHGHSYKVEVTFRGHPQNEMEQASDYGMVIDFGDVKAYWKSEMEPLLDHRNLNDTLGPTIGATTAENIAWWIWSVFMTMPNREGVACESVRVWETETGMAEWRDDA